MRFIIITTSLLLSFSNLYSQNCKPKDCVIPVSSQCVKYCKDRVIKYSDSSELKIFGYSSENIDKIYQLRELEKNYIRFDSHDIEKKFEIIIGEKKYYQMNQKDVIGEKDLDIKINKRID